MFAVKNIEVVETTEKLPNTQFFIRSNTSYGVGLSLRPTGLYCNKAFAIEGSLVTSDILDNYHITMVWDSENSVIKIYVNGTFKIDYPFSDTQCDGSFFNVVKFYNTLNLNRAHSAEISFFAEYNRALTESEILQNYNADIGGNA